MPPRKAPVRATPAKKAAKKAPATARTTRKSAASPSKRASTAKKSATRKAPAKKAPAKRPSGRARTSNKVAPVVIVEFPASEGLVREVQAFINSRKGAADWGERHDALAELALTLAANLASGSAGMATAAVARELRATLTDMAPKEVDGDGLEFLANSSTPVGDTQES